jgi:hypothetical protein
MKPAARILLLSAILLGGCRAAHDVAVTSFRVIDAPAHYVRRHIDSESDTATTTTTTTAQSDTVTPGHTVNPSPAPRDTTKRRTTQEQAGPGPTHGQIETFADSGAKERDDSSAISHRAAGAE